MFTLNILKGKFSLPKALSAEDKKELKHLTDAYRVNKKFFGIDVPKFQVKLFNTRAEFNKEVHQRKTPRWLAAYSNKRRIAIFMPSVFERLTSHRLSAYRQILTHEMNHVFYGNFVGHYAPIWLIEGLARNVAGQGRETNEPVNTDYLFYTYSDKKAYKNKAGAYHLCVENGYYFTKFILEKDGKSEIINFLRKYKVRKDKKVYDLSMKKWVAELKVASSVAK